MCLKTVDFALEYQSGTREYVGYGYKSLPTEDVVSLKKWKQATGSLNGRGSLTMKIFSSDYNLDKQEYHPGFHIFLKEEDARLYNSEEPGYSIIKVKYKDVLAFGTNSNNGGGSGPCVIAKFMKLEEVIESFDEEVEEELEEDDVY